MNFPQAQLRTKESNQPIKSVWGQHFQLFRCYNFLMAGIPVVPLFIHGLLAGISYPFSLQVSQQCTSPLLRSASFLQPFPLIVAEILFNWHLWLQYTLSQINEIAITFRTSNFERSFFPALYCLHWSEWDKRCSLGATPKTGFFGNFSQGGGGVFAIPKTISYLPFHFLFAKPWKFWGGVPYSQT